MLPAQRDIAFIRAQENLFTGTQDFPVTESGIEMGPPAAPADCRNFFNPVRDLQKPAGALEQHPPEICPQPVTDDRNIKIFYGLFVY